MSSSSTSSGSVEGSAKFVLDAKLFTRDAFVVVHIAYIYIKYTILSTNNSSSVLCYTVGIVCMEITREDIDILAGSNTMRCYFSNVLTTFINF